jgi:leucyl aminopeptidase
VSTPSFSISSAFDFSTDATVIFGLKLDDGETAFVGPDEFRHVLDTARTVGAKAQAESVTKLAVTGIGSGLVALLGLGRHENDARILRESAGAASKKLADQKHLVFALDSHNHESVLATLEGALLGCYEFNRYKTDANEVSKVETITVITVAQISPEDLAKVQEKVQAVNLVKDLVNTPSSDLTPHDLASEALAIVDTLPVTAQVWTELELERDGFGGILGVGAGSINPPRLVKLSYQPKNYSKHIALVGKGITFDTGGLTLKSGAGMVGMKYDMTGAATALAVIHACASLKVDVRVTTWLCLAENMPSATATKPNDVLRIRNGKTVEVLNTDAEGRLVLADGLSAASEEVPDLIVDIATLTGAARGALGTRTVGVMGNTDDISRLVESAAVRESHFGACHCPRNFERC